MPEQAKRVSRPNRTAVTGCILKHHNKPRVLVLSYRPQRALKDRADRERAIQKLQARLKQSKNPKQLVSQYGFQKFIKVEGEAELRIDQEKLAEESRWDGVMGLYMNDPELTDEEVTAHYRGLWQVEESFRIQKHDLKIRPIYHWTSQRIKAHIAIAFMAFVCVRYLEYRVKTQSQKISPKSIRDALMQYQASFIKDNQTNKTYLLPSKISAEVKELYRVIGVKLHEGLKEVA
jgi:transposase